MLREDKPFELLFDVEDDAECHEAGQLCDFVRHCLAKSYPSFREATQDYAEVDAICDAFAPVESSHNLIVFDIKSMIAVKNGLKSAMLSPRSVSKYIIRPDHPSSIPKMDMLRSIQHSLHAADHVFVFSSEHVMPLLMLGARNPIRLSMPATHANRAQPNSNPILIINHLSDQKTLSGVMTSLAAHGSLVASALDCGSNDAEANPDRNVLAGAMIHLHIGARPGNHAPLRIIDSYAQGKLVIHLDDPSAHRSHYEAECLQTQVKHNISGFHLQKIRDVVPAVQNLLADAAMADLFRRAGDRIVRGFNTGIEQQILAVLT